MIIRIVRMGFDPDKVDSFLELFEKQKDSIRGFPGCIHLELLQDADDQSVFSTYSHWESPEDLENYRKSPLFGEVWPATKKLFNRKPVANSYYSKMLVGGV